MDFRNKESKNIKPEKDKGWHIFLKATVAVHTTNLDAELTEIGNKTFLPGDGQFNLNNNAVCLIHLP